MLKFSSVEKKYFSAFLAVMATSAALTYLVILTTQSVAVPFENANANLIWIFTAGAIAGFFALFAARGYLGGPGVLGFFRAFIGSTAAAIIGSAIAGILIVPLYGIFYGPVVAATELVARPWLAVAWYAIMIGTHILLKGIADKRTWGLGGDTIRTPLSSQLSPLTRAQLYHRD